MERKEFLKSLEEILDLPGGTLNGTESIEDLDNWDSMAMLNYIALADSAGTGDISQKQIAACNSVSDLMKLAKIG